MIYDVYCHRSDYVLEKPENWYKAGYFALQNRGLYIFLSYRHTFDMDPQKSSETELNDLKSALASPLARSDKESQRALDIYHRCNGK